MKNLSERMDILQGMISNENCKIVQSFYIFDYNISSTYENCYYSSNFRLDDYVLLKIY